MVALIQSLAVAEHLSFRHAASYLGISQSTVSARVKALEEDLGVILFERNTRGVRLTEAGRIFVEHVTTGIEQLNHAVKIAGMTASGASGRIRVGVHTLIPHSFASKIIGQFRQTYPAVNIRISENSARIASTLLRENRLDIAFVAGKPNLPDHRSRHVWTEQLMAALPSHHPLAGRNSVEWGELASEPFLVRQGGTGPQVRNHILRRLEGHWPAPKILRFDVEYSSLLTLVGQGFGLTIVSEAATYVPTSDLVFLPISDELEPVTFSAIWSPHNRNPAVAKLLSLADRCK